MNKVKISDFHISQSFYNTGDYKYRVKDLIEVSKSLQSFDLPLQAIDISYSPWGEIDIQSFVYHSKRVTIADSKHPIILSDKGVICDGWHRIVKAILKGESTIKAVRLEVMPDCV